MFKTYNFKTHRNREKSCFGSKKRTVIPATEVLFHANIFQ